MGRDKPNTGDHELGMQRKITRRDFLDGVALAIGGSILAGVPGLSATQAGKEGPAPENSPEYYPPALLGMRGNHPGSFEVAHRLRDGTFWETAGKPEYTGEKYDLVIVGGGISGLAAAYFYRQAAGSKARILILENHADFGGHAKRNEFRVGKRLLLSNGGTQSIDNPSEYSKVAKGLLTELGIQLQEFYRDYDSKLYSHLQTACFFDRETFGTDRLVVGMNSLPWKQFLAQTPLSEIAKRDIERVYTEKADYMAGMSPVQKSAELARISYAEFLTKYCKVSPQALPFFQKFPHDLFAVGIEAVSALSCFENPDDYESFKYAGFDGLGLGEPHDQDPYIFHFPDGNASIARLLVRSLIPGSIPGNTMDDIVTAHADYSRLDRAGAPARLRLNSTAVRARHNGLPEQAQEVEVDYVRGGKLLTVRAGRCILACYNMMIPYLCPELPEKQKAALHYDVKEPFIYTHVALRNWKPFAKLGTQQVVAPGGYHSLTKLDFPVSMGKYEFPHQPDEPMVLFMLRCPCKPGLARKAQYRAGRWELMATPFATFERNIRDQLQRMLGGAGFDAARDIAGITVNRWAHGYAYEYNSLSDPDWPEEQRPCVIGRQKFGRISIANSDAGASAYTDTAIDQAWRAVREQA
ncbi:MAG TPA: FAD/NAD(P)-binding protein [Terriglobales bacterium]|nr:FAD/NAD(P)-binding protein [Terriglobales bacterium]